jgi:hypothetical protein
LSSGIESHGHIKEPVDLLEYVVTIRKKTLAEDHPDRLISEAGLRIYCEIVASRVKTRKGQDQAVKGVFGD